MTEEKKQSLAYTRVLQPWQKFDVNLRFPKERIMILGFFGVPSGIIVPSVKIGAFAYEEMGAVGKSVFPGQPLVVTLENVTAKPIALEGAFLAFESFPVETKVMPPSVESSPEPEGRKDRTLLPFLLVFGGHAKIVGFHVKENCTFEEVWMEGCTLEEVKVMYTSFSGTSLHAWQGMFMAPGTPVELRFVPKSTTTHARAVVRLEKAFFPPR